MVINSFSFFINLIQKYDWNILCLLNSSFSFFKYQAASASLISYLSQINKINVIFYCTTGAKNRQENTSSSSSLTGLFEETCILVGIQFSFIIMASTSKAFNKCVDPCPRYLRWHTQSLRLLFGQGARTRCPWGENLCATSSTFAGRRHMFGKVVTGCVAILSYHTATQDRGSECRDFGFISRIVTALWIGDVKCIRFSKNVMNMYEWGRTNLYELATSQNMYELPWDRAGSNPSNTPSENETNYCMEWKDARWRGSTSRNHLRGC